MVPGVGFVMFIMPIVVLGLLFVIFLRIMDHLKLRATLAQNTREGVDPDGIAERLDDIERRLTDVQDVMIALSEKFDRWESQRVQPAPRP